MLINMFCKPLNATTHPRTSRQDARHHHVRGRSEAVSEVAMCSASARLQRAFKKADEALFCGGKAAEIYSQVGVARRDCHLGRSATAPAVYTMSERCLVRSMMGAAPVCRGGVCLPLEQQAAGLKLACSGREMQWSRIPEKTQMSSNWMTELFGS